MTRSLTTLTALFVFWLLLSGVFTPFFIAVGAGSSLAILLLARRMERFGRPATPSPIRWARFPSYYLWLLKEIGVAAIDVSKCILHPRLPISPALVEFVPTQTTDVGLVIHATSITLTPGTISVEVERGRFLVHALSSEAAASLAGSEMDRRCAALEAGS